MHGMAISGWKPSRRVDPVRFLHTVSLMFARTHLRRFRLPSIAALCTVAAWCLFAAPAHAEDQKDQDNFFKRAAKVIGRDAKSGAKQAGHAFKELGKDVGHGTKKAAKDIGHGAKDSVERTRKALKDAVK